MEWTILLDTTITMVNLYKFKRENPNLLKSDLILIDGFEKDGEKRNSSSSQGNQSKNY